MNIYQQSILLKEKKNKINKEGFNLINNLFNYESSYNDLNNEKMYEYSSTIARISKNNPYKNNNIKVQLYREESETPISEYGYVNNMGVMKPYLENVDYRSTTWGQNGCPTNLSTKNIGPQDVIVNEQNLFEIQTDPNIINLIFPMIPGQACGFEGENVYVNNIGNINDYTTNYLGAYATDLSNVDNSSNLFTFDLCKTRAVDLGMKYFGLNSFDSQLSSTQCVVSNNLSDFETGFVSEYLVVLYDTSNLAPFLNESNPNNVILLELVEQKFTMLFKNSDGVDISGIIIDFSSNLSNTTCKDGGKINTIQATWGSNCNSSGYNIESNNVGQYIVDYFNSGNYADMLYQIGTNGKGENLGDPAPGCYKNFNASYQCGNSTETININSESWGKVAKFSCVQEELDCINILFLDNDGLIYISTRSDIDITNNIVSLKDGSQPVYTWDFSQQLGIPCTYAECTQNYIFIAKEMIANDFILSPDKKLALYYSSGVHFQVVTFMNSIKNINDTNYGLRQTNALYEVTNMPAESNVGKVAWITAAGFRKQYPDNLLEYSSEYDSFPGWNSVGNNITSETMSITEGKQWCNDNSGCAGFEYINGVCYFKNSNMYPNGTRQVTTNSNILYVRRPKVINSEFCGKQLNNIGNLTWDKYITDVFTGEYMDISFNCGNNILDPGLLTDDSQQKLQQQINKINSHIYFDASQLLQQTSVQNEQNDNLYKFFYPFTENFENNNMNTNNVNNNNNTNNMNVTYLNKLLENSKTFVSQQLYIIITLFVILLGLVIIIYKIKK
jgi:hypothetical protein